jgi:uncharacterized membrane protein YeaQ/YmgE (transglycosylase-associated protein family)
MNTVNIANETDGGKAYSDLAEVWQDVVSRRHLAISVVFGIVLGMGGYFFGIWLLRTMNFALKPDLLKGYALFFGVGGCVLAAIIACIQFKPKRIISEATAETDQFLEALREQNISVKDELAALKSLPPVIRRELEDVKVYDRLVEILETEQRQTTTDGGKEWK